MGIFDWFKNNLDEERVVVQAPEDKNRQTVDDDITKSLHDASIQELQDFLKRLKEVSKDKRSLYEVYDKMSNDSLISGAMKILSDDVVKKDFIRDKRFWAEPTIQNSEDGQRIVDKVNDFLEDFDMDKKVWGYAYQLLKYGQVFLKTYNKEFDENKIEEEFKDRRGTIFEIVDNPADVLALEKYGTPVGYGVQKRDEDGKITDGYELVSTKEYIHIVQDQKMVRQNVNLKYKREKDEDYKVDNFKSIIGTSYLEDAREAWTILDLIETLLLFVRYNHSDVFNLVTVEVGNASRTEATRILRDTKRTFNTQDAMNIKDKTYTGYKKPIPHGENIYSATRNGKGAIKVDQIGGDVDIKNLTDLDYWRDKLVAALTTPKAYLGLDDGNLTGLNNQSLTRQDIRYCRTVQATKDPLIYGVKSICDFYLESVGEGNSIDDYQIVGADILSAETTDRMEDINARIELANALKDFMSQVKTIDMDKAIQVIVQKILDLKSVDPEFDDIWNNKIMIQDPEDAEDVETTPSDDEEDTDVNLNVNADNDQENQEPEEETPQEDQEIPQLAPGPGAPV